MGAVRDSVSQARKGPSEKQQHSEGGVSPAPVPGVQLKRSFLPESGEVVGAQE